MRTPVAIATSAFSALCLVGLAAAQGAKPLKKCPLDSVVSGTVCMDKYEASVWRLPDPLARTRVW